MICYRKRNKHTHTLERPLLGSLLWHELLIDVTHRCLGLLPKTNSSHGCSGVFFDMLDEVMVFLPTTSTSINKPSIGLPYPKLTNRTWKWMVGRRWTFLLGRKTAYFQVADWLLVSGRVIEVYTPVKYCICFWFLYTQVKTKIHVGCVSSDDSIQITARLRPCLGITHVPSCWDSEYHNYMTVSIVSTFRI